MTRRILPQAIAKRSIRSQTGALFFAGLFLLVAAVFAISMLVSESIRVDGLLIAQLEAEQGFGEAPAGAATEEIAAIRERRDGNIGMVRGLFAALFLASLVFLFIGLWFIQQIIVSPLEALHLVARRVATGDLDTPAELGGAQEFQDLAASFEGMRLELREARARQSRWTAELETRVSQRTQQLAALSQVTATASRSLELDVLGATALEQALLVMDMEAGGLWLLEEDGTLRLSAETGMSPRARARLQRLAPEQGVTGRAGVSGLTVVVEDLLISPELSSPVVLEEGFRGMVAVPIRLRERILGVLDVFTSRPRAFSADEVALLTSIGQQIGIALDSVRLLHEVRATAERLAGLQERERIGIELHDGLLQTLGYLYLKTDQMEELAARNGLTELARQLAAQRDVLEQSSQDVRRFISHLDELPPPPARLQDALEEMVDDFRATAPGDTPLRVDFRVEAPDRRLPAEVVIHLVAIAREALTNAALHGRAKHATIDAEQSAAEEQLTVVDDGSGFDPAQPPNDGRFHFGLTVMQARAARIGGRLDIESTPGCGTRVRVRWPLARRGDDGHTTGTGG
jgi:two-component system, NarL family, nitrate/nitrite sensor histidine kinase NarX